MYASRTWTWNEVERSRIIAVVEVSYRRGACGLNKMDGKSNESVSGRFGMFFKSKGMNCRVVRVVKHMDRMGGEELTKRIYECGGE